MKHRLALAMTGLALPAQAQVRNDPAGSSPILAALEWVQGTMLGNVATAAAVIAVAVVGFLMLTGRIEWRRGRRLLRATGRRDVDALHHERPVVGDLFLAL